MKTKKSIVFITQSLSLTGSEIALFNMISSASTEFNCTVVVLNNGELIASLPQQVKCIVLDRQSRNSSTFFQRQASRLRERALLNNIKAIKADLWYINTIMPVDILQLAEQEKKRTVVHVHELEHMYAGLTNEQLRRLIGYPELIIACSNAAATVLRTLGRNRTEVIYPTTPVRPGSPEPRTYACKKLGINTDSLIWLMAGTMDSNKDPLFFISVADKCQVSNTAFVWLTHGAENGYTEYCRQLVVEKNLQKKIFFVSNPAADYINYFAAANGILITSHKESFSLVALEALEHGIPVVTSDCGGVTEIIKSNMGTIVPARIPELFAEAIAAYSAHAAHYDRSAATAHAGMFSREIITAQWMNTIRSLLK
jgi:L-malate glycosyltransferase